MISRTEIMDLALAYCSHRETSRSKLKAYLFRKCAIDVNQTPADELTVLDEVLDELERLKVIDHERYAEVLTRDYARRGKGHRYVENKLKENGLEAETKKFEVSADDELNRAIELAKKTLERASIQKIGDPYLKRQKILQKLASSGFDFSVAKKAIELTFKTE